MSAYDWFLVAWFLLGVLLTIANVGKPRTPMAPSTAALATLLSLSIVVGLLISRGAL